jgi:cobalt-zinc-cadmium efflux system outer membrane protein
MTTLTRCAAAHFATGVAIVWVVITATADVSCAMPDEAMGSRIDGSIVDALPSDGGRSSDAQVHLRALIDEAMQHSPTVAAARARWQARMLAPIQARTLPDPQVQLQQLTVGSPQPFSGYETSDFFYTGFGVSQDFPGPGKLALHGAIAEREADYAHHQLEAVQREVVRRIRESYFELFYLKRTIELLESHRADLGQIEEISESRYRVGLATQQDMVRAQLEMTAILREVTMHHQHMEQQQAMLKALLGRDTDSRDIEIREAAPTKLDVDPMRVRELTSAGAPELQMERAMESRSSEALKLARRGYLPDFSVGYMVQKTGPGVRDYYALTLGARIPLYFWRKQTPAIAQASLESTAAHQDAVSRELELTADAQNQLTASRTAERIMNIYRAGLLPQAQTSMETAMAAYRVGKADFQTLINAFIQLLQLHEEYYRTLADHEIAVARVQQIIGDVK